MSHSHSGPWCVVGSKTRCHLDLLARNWSGRFPLPPTPSRRTLSQRRPERTTAYLPISSIISARSRGDGGDVFSSILGCWGWDWAGHNERVPASFLRDIRRGGVAEHLELEEDKRLIFKHHLYDLLSKEERGEGGRTNLSVRTGAHPI